jgi:hypothetical protein
MVMKNGFEFSNHSPVEASPSPLSSRPKRTRISYVALLATQIIKATGLYGKSGGA